MRKIFTVVQGVLILIVLHPLAAEELFTAEVYLQGSNKSQLIYNYVNKIEQQDGVLTLTHQYLYPSGRLFAGEEVVLSGGEFLTHSTTFPDLGEKSILYRDGNNMEMRFTRDGKEKRKNISYSDSLIFGPTQQDFIKENLDLLKNYRKTSFQLPVPEFLTTTRFTLRRIDDSEYLRDGTIVLEMKSNNLLLLFFTKPIQFVVDEDSGRILEIHGPTVLKHKVREKWEFLIADIYFEY